MNYLTILNQTVNASLNSGRIGTPVFVRWTASVAESKSALKMQLAEMAAYTGCWLSAGLHRIYATGTESQQHLSLTLEYDTGSSGLLALTLAHNHPHMSLAIYGSHGALYHNEFISPIRDGSLSRLQVGCDENVFDQDPRVFRDAIEQSLALYQPIALGHSGGQS